MVRRDAARLREERGKARRRPEAPPEKAQVRETIPDLGLFVHSRAADVTVDDESTSTLTIYRPPAQLGC